MSERRFLALSGSPRGKSTSETLCRHLADGLVKLGWSASVLRIPPAMRSEEKWTELMEQYRQADVIVLCTPLYVDSLPGEVTQTLERLTEIDAPKRDRRMFAIVNCGYLEAEHNDTALAICRLFARDAGLAWLGGLALGGGGAINATPLERLGGSVAHVIRTLELAVKAVDAGQPIPDEAQQLIRRRFCPTWLFVLMGNVGMMKGARDNHMLMKINAKPYA